VSRSATASDMVTPRSRSSLLSSGPTQTQSLPLPCRHAHSTTAAGPAKTVPNHGMLVHACTHLYAHLAHTYTHLVLYTLVHLYCIHLYTLVHLYFCSSRGVSCVGHTLKADNVWTSALHTFSEDSLRLRCMSLLDTLPMRCSKWPVRVDLPASTCPICSTAQGRGQPTWPRDGARGAGQGCSETRWIAVFQNRIQSIEQNFSCALQDIIHRTDVHLIDRFTITCTCANPWHVFNGYRPSENPRMISHDCAILHEQYPSTIAPPHKSHPNCTYNDKMNSGLFFFCLDHGCFDPLLRDILREWSLLQERSFWGSRGAGAAVPGSNASGPFPPGGSCAEAPWASGCPPVSCSFRFFTPAVRARACAVPGWLADVAGFAGLARAFSCAARAMSSGDGESNANASASEATNRNDSNRGSAWNQQTHISVAWHWPHALCRLHNPAPL